jgi:DNA-binding LacI/PurR family transcriptional regulator
VGFDDIPEALFFAPPLTTVSHPLREIGSMASQKVHEIIEGLVEPPRRATLSGGIVVKPRLIVRESSRK